MSKKLKNISEVIDPMGRVPKDYALEYMNRDFANRAAIADAIPSVGKFGGNPVRGIVDRLTKNMIAMAEGRLPMPNGEAQEATGDSMSTNLPSTITQAFPLLYRTFAEEVAFDLVTIQPMDHPTGTVAWVNEEYGEAKADNEPAAITAGTRMDQQISRNYASSSEGADANKVQVDFDSRTIDTAKKALKTHVTPELMQDLTSLYGEDAQAIANNILSRALRTELGYLIMYQLVSNAGAGNVTWSVTPPAGSSVVNAEAYRKRIWHAVVDARNLIYDAIYKNPNFLVTSSTVWARFQKTMENFEVNPALRANPDLIQYRYLAGTTEDGMRCYVDPFFPVANTILVGRKGADWKDGHAFYAPYVPYWETPGWYDPDDGGKWKRYAMTRYGKNAAAPNANTMILEPNAFATITLTSS